MPRGETDVVLLESILKDLSLIKRLILWPNRSDSIVPCPSPPYIMTFLWWGFGAHSAPSSEISSRNPSSEILFHLVVFDSWTGMYSPSGMACDYVCDGKSKSQNVTVVPAPPTSQKPYSSPVSYPEWYVPVNPTHPSKIVLQGKRTLILFSNPLPRPCNSLLSPPSERLVPL